jgi:hypothetical protein
MRGNAPTSARYSRLEGTDDSIRIKVKTLDNESTWEVEGEGSWTVRQLKDHVGRQACAPAVQAMIAAGGPGCRAKDAANYAAHWCAACIVQRGRPVSRGCARGSVDVTMLRAGEQLKETKDLKERRIRLILLGRMLEVFAAPACRRRSSHLPFWPRRRPPSVRGPVTFFALVQAMALIPRPAAVCMRPPSALRIPPGLAHTKLVRLERWRLRSCSNFRRGGCPSLLLFRPLSLPQRVACSSASCCWSCAWMLGAAAVRETGVVPGSRASPRVFGSTRCGTIQTRPEDVPQDVPQDVPRPLMHPLCCGQLPPAPDVAIDMDRRDRDEEDSVRGFDRLYYAHPTPSPLDQPACVAHNGFL